MLKRGIPASHFFGSDIVPYYYQRCMAGYNKAISELNIPVTDALIYKNINSFKDAEVCLRKVMSDSCRPTAICCSSDICAAYVLRSANILGLLVPADLSLISIDDIPLSSFLNPPLTTTSYPKFEMGVKTADILLRMVNGEQVESVVMPSDRIIERQSVLELHNGK